jgi:hypothetical protein
MRRSPAAQLNMKPLWSLLVRILASVTERTVGVSVGSVCSMSSHTVLIDVVCEADQQWMIRARRPPGSESHQATTEVRRSAGNAYERLSAL